MMKAQASVEFLWSFAAALLMVSVIAAALLSHKASLDGKAGDIDTIYAAESAARAVESAMNAGVGLSFGFDSMRYSAEEDRFLVSYKGETVEIDGVFHHDAAEPV
jgi:uncharacterized protein (UPF0333 family)